MKQLLKKINTKSIILLLVIAGIIYGGFNTVKQNSQYYVMYFPETTYQLDESQVNVEYGTIGVVSVTETFHTGNGYMAVAFKRIITGPVDTTINITIQSSNPEKPQSVTYDYHLYVDKLGIIHNKELNNYSAQEYITGTIAGILGVMSLAFLFMFIQRVRRNSCSDRTMINLMLSMLLLITGIAFAIFSYNAKYAPMYNSILPMRYVLLQELHKYVLAMSIISGLMSLRILATKEKTGAVTLLISILIGAGFTLIKTDTAQTAILIDSVATSISAVALAHFISAFICTVLAGKHKPAFDKAYIILFSHTKDEEIDACADRAVDFYIEQIKNGQDSSFIATGNKANLIKDILIEKGVSETKIILESKSKSLQQSFIRTHKLISLNFAGAYATFVTPDYKVYQTGNVASNLMLSIEGMGAKTSGKLTSLTVKNMISVIKTSMVLEIIILLISIAIPIITTLI